MPQQRQFFLQAFLPISHRRLFRMQDIASLFMAMAMDSVESAISSRETSEYFMPSCPIARPSHTAMAGKTSGTPPARATPCFTASTTLSRFMCPGTMSFFELTMPISGRSISSSVRPRAFMSASLGAAEGPLVILSLRICFSTFSFSGRLSAHGRVGSLMVINLSSANCHFSIVYIFRHCEWHKKGKRKKISRML